jgi:hypothetical protein
MSEAKNHRLPLDLAYAASKGMITDQELLQELLERVAALEVQQRCNLVKKKKAESETKTQSRQGRRDVAASLPFIRNSLGN